MANSCAYAKCYSSWQASLMRSLDSYFACSTRVRQRIVLVDPNGLAFVKEEKFKISTLEKILKIMSFIIFFPLVIVALAIRNFLHKKLDRFSIKCLYLPTEMTREEELIFAANPQLVKEAVLTAVPLFYYTPKKYQLIKFEALEGQAPKITFSINIELLLEDLDLQSLNWPTKYLYDDLDFTGHPEEEALINKIRAIEGKDSEEMSLESKKLLVLHFLECICTQHPTLNEEDEGTVHIRLPFTYHEHGYKTPINVCRYKKTIWYKIFFWQTGSAFRNSPGSLVYDRLVKLGVFTANNYCSLVRTQYISASAPFRALFEADPISMLKLAGFLF
ncbi:Family of unknown function (DUF648) [Chlamydia serpentis]|uniref:Uncharacterized protein n=1 Tax=Chlamydia serpentis TaxID=1967782 RepID=A0A2R8FAL4_9CHLA|nr:DUF648 domain-containing protein [Chlamydia serpentis]SPN73346.1 Family of unknown function (DUF648) [Chlamydia serpentis]